MRYKKEHTPQVLIAGKEYGTGSSRDWAAKGVQPARRATPWSSRDLRAHPPLEPGRHGRRPCTLEEGTTWASLGLKGDEKVTIKGLEKVKPRQKMEAEVTFADGKVKKVPILCRIDTLDEIEYFKNGGILQYVLRDLAS